MANKKIKLILSGFLILVTATAFAQSSNFTIGGEILTNDIGNIYIYLVDEVSSKTPLTGIKVIVIKNKGNNRNSQNVSFQFENVEEGIYGIRCYQDVNGNEKLDKGLFGPKEPWWLSWQEEKHSIFPKFKDIAFKVDSNIKDIQITLDMN